MWSLLAAALLLAATAQAQVKLPFLFTDGLVLQREQPVRIWGEAAPGERVGVAFRGEEKSATADDLGHWELFLSPKAAGGPFELTVKASNQIVLHDVLVGDVWVASGQSNMELPLTRADNGKQLIAAANNPKIRILRVRKQGSEFPLRDTVADAPWGRLSPETTPEFSAIAYYFATEIQQKEDVPIGIISSLWGGTVAEAWTSLEGLASDASLMPLFTARARMVANRADNDLIDASEKRAKDADKAADKPEPDFPWRPWPAMWAPSQLYNAMIAPVTRYTIKGVIWYQGESNSIKSRVDGYPQLYAKVFPLMIRDWREHWGEGDFPFLFVQLPNFKSWDGEDWAVIREAQRKALCLRNTAMVEAIDVGNPDNVHPTNKQPVGHRLALAARATVYGENVEFSGPLFRQATVEDGALRVWFDHAAGLTAKGGEVKGFEIAGADGNFVPATAKIEGSTVIVSNDKVKYPVIVRYGWANNPEVNLFNAEGLPAAPFASK
jgi:sialate O-acetylesterase